MPTKLSRNLTTNEALVKVAFHSQGKIAKALADYATWAVSGIAVVIGAFLVNSENVIKAVLPEMLKWGMVVLICSLVVGGLCKQAGEAFLAGLESIESLIDALSTLDPNENVELDQEIVVKHLLAGYLWPLSAVVKRSFYGGVHDSLRGEKILMKVLSIQVFLSWLLTLSTAAGLLVLAFGLK